MANLLFDKSLEMSVQIALFHQAYVSAGLSSQAADKLLTASLEVGEKIHKSIYGEDEDEFTSILQDALMEVSDVLYLLNVLLQSKLVAYDYVYLIDMAEEIKTMLITSIKAAKTKESKWDQYTHSEEFLV